MVHRNATYCFLELTLGPSFSVDDIPEVKQPWSCEVIRSQRALASHSTELTFRAA